MQCAVFSSETAPITVTGEEHHFWRRVVEEQYCHFAVRLMMKLGEQREQSSHENTSVAETQVQTLQRSRGRVGSCTSVCTECFVIFHNRGLPPSLPSISLSCCLLNRAAIAYGSTEISLTPLFSVFRELPFSFFRELHLVFFVFVKQFAIRHMEKCSRRRRCLKTVSRHLAKDKKQQGK